MTEHILYSYVLFDYNEITMRILERFGEHYERPALGIMTPEASNRAISQVDPAIIALSLDQNRVGSFADTIRFLFEHEFAAAGVPFPATERPNSDGKMIRVVDPLRTGLVLWEYENGVAVEAAGIDRNTIEEVLGYAALSQAEVDEIAIAYHDPCKMPE